MDLNFGGPVWHASIRTLGGQSDEVARRLALRALEGVGDGALAAVEEQIAATRKRIAEMEAEDAEKEPKNV